MYHVTLPSSERDLQQESNSCAVNGLTPRAGFEPRRRAEPVNFCHVSNKLPGSSGAADDDPGAITTRAKAAAEPRDRAKCG